MKFQRLKSGMLQTLLFILLLNVHFNAEAQSSLREIFENPPDEARPRGYWLWAHGNFDYATMQKELKEFSEMGLGGVDIFDMGIADPLDIIPSGNTFMGDEMVDGIAYALEIAKEHNLQMGLSVSNGWNAGGDWTTADEKLMRLLFWSDTVSGPLHLKEIGFPEVPTTFQKPYGSYQLFPEFDAEGFPKYFENVALVAYPVRPDSLIDRIDQIIYFETDNIDGNSMELELSAGEWVVMRAVVTPLGQKMWMRSDNSNGFIMDHYSKKATKHHFEHIISKLEARIGDLGESALERLYLASFEAEDYVIWSPELRESFYRHHGYRIDPYIPVFSGLTIVDEQTTGRFLHDYRTTVSEMFVDNHYRQGSSISREHGLLLASESGGPGPPLHYVPTEDLKALGAVDIMRGEFWNSPKRWDDIHGNNLLQVVKNIASAAHVYGHKIVEMEAFTSHNKHWEETPMDLKILADRAFCEGMTRVVYHTMPHSPPEAGEPGWSYQAGTHIHPKMTWWPMIRSFNDYLARCGAMLMQGNFVADVAYYKGGEVPNFSTAKYIRPDLGFGYDYDDINTEVLLQTSQVEDGRIVLPSGMQYELIVLPDDDRMHLEALIKLEELIRKGATVIGKKPKRIYGLANYQEKEKRLNDIADQIWGRSSKARLDRKYGEGRIICGKTARQVLLEKEIQPDLQVATKEQQQFVDFIHRTSPGHEVYFIRNKDSVAHELDISFRAKDMLPEFWHPEDGQTRPLHVYRQTETGTEIPIHLEAHASIFVVFTKSAGAKAAVSNIMVKDRQVYPSASGVYEGVSLVEADSETLSLLTDQPGVYTIWTSAGEKLDLEVEEPYAEMLIDGPWDVRFPAGWRVDPLQHFEDLKDWTTFEEPDLKHFSGVATYRNTFIVEQHPKVDEFQWILDLGEVGAVASVYLNGAWLGDSMFPNHRLDISSALVEGENYLVVEVANTWRNRLILDTHLPAELQLTRSNLANSSDPQDRPWKNYSLQTSGLMGPVKIIKYKQFEINLK